MMERNSERFLKKYRVLEGLLEKRYEGQKVSSSSIVIEYIRDDDSEPVRVDLDLMREIRNILSHNAGENGEAVVEPSDEMLERLDRILAYVRRPRCAAGLGTPAAQVLCAHPSDSILPLMRSMRKSGYSHAPVKDDGRIVGVFSIRCLFDYLAENDLDGIDNNIRIRDLGERIRLDRKHGERYMFVSEDTSIVTIRRAFRRYPERNRRLSAVFVTRSGSPEEELICIITPWDVLSDQTTTKESNHGTGKAQGGECGS